MAMHFGSPRSAPLDIDVIRKRTMHDPPSVHIQASDLELLKVDARELADKLAAAGNDVEYRELSAMPHAWHCFAPLLPESRAAVVRAADFIRCCWRGASASAKY